MNRLTITSIGLSTTLLLLLAVVPLSLYGASNLGGKAGSFLRVGVGAEQIAMGDAGAASVHGSALWYYNPAQLPFQEYKRVNLSLRQMAFDRSIIETGYSMALPPNAGLSIGFLRAGTGNVELRDANGVKYDDITQSDNLVFGSFALAPIQKLAVGINLKWMFQMYPKLTADDKTFYGYAMGIDGGVMYLPLTNLRFGVTVQDFDTKYSYQPSEVWRDESGQTEDPFPTMVRIGGSYDPIKDLTVVGDAVINYDQVKSLADGWSPHFGAEYRYSAKYHSEFALRAGWNGAHPTFGLGLSYDYRGYVMRMNYAYIISDIEPSGSHQVGWCFEFGGDER